MLPETARDIPFEPKTALFLCEFAGRAEAAGGAADQLPVGHGEGRGASGRIELQGQRLFRQDDPRHCLPRLGDRPG